MTPFFQKCDAQNVAKYGSNLKGQNGSNLKGQNSSNLKGQKGSIWSKMALQFFVGCFALLTSEAIDADFGSFF